MQIFYDIAKWQTERLTISGCDSLGFVPTMGNLHCGHVSLIEKSQLENSHTIVSIFVNPTQFNQQEDFTNYPRTLENDLNILEKLGVNYCLIPLEKDLYPDNYAYRVNIENATPVMENLHRPGHFSGVLSVVMKLLNIVKPNICYFGEKDYQQFHLIKEMIHAFFMDIEVKSCPTVREKSGLALSSRNSRLNQEERKLAENFAKIFHTNQSCEVIQQDLIDLGIKVEYLEEHQKRRFVAVTIGNVRLIDNKAID